MKQHPQQSVAEVMRTPAKWHTKSSLYALVTVKCCKQSLMHSVIHSLTIRHSCLTSTKRQDHRYWKCWSHVPQGVSFMSMNIQEHLESTSIHFYGTYKYSYHQGMIHWQTITQEAGHSESARYPLVLCGIWVQQQ